MSRPYTPRAVLRQLPLDLLRQVLDRERIDLKLDWAAVPGPGTG